MRSPWFLVLPILIFIRVGDLIVACDMEGPESVSVGIAKKTDNWGMAIAGVKNCRPVNFQTPLDWQGEKKSSAGDAAGPPPPHVHPSFRPDSPPGPDCGGAGRRGLVGYHWEVFQ